MGAVTPLGQVFKLLASLDFGGDIIGLCLGLSYNSIGSIGGSWNKNLA